MLLKLITLRHEYSLQPVVVNFSHGLISELILVRHEKFDYNTTITAVGLFNSYATLKAKIRSVGFQIN